MSRGGARFERTDIADSYDPRIEGRAATKGTVFRYIPVVGEAVILIKQDEGFTTNWTCGCDDATGPTAARVATFGDCEAPGSPALGISETFQIIGATTITNVGNTVITGDLALSPGVAVVGFPPGTVSGTQNITNAVAAQAQVDATAAYNDLAARTGGVTVVGNLNGQTFLPGVYKVATSMDLSVGGTVTLDAAGDPDAVWIFQVGSTLTINNGSTVVIINGGSAANVYWQVGSSATIGTTATMLGTIIALASITANNGASVDGRLFALTGAVTLDDITGTVITQTECGNIDILVAPATIDGITLAIGDVVLVKDQTLLEENGVYRFNGVGVPLTRVASWDEATEFLIGRQVFIAEGVENALTLWANLLPVTTLGTSPVQFGEISAVDFMKRDFSNALPALNSINMGGYEINNLTYAIRVIDATDTLIALTDQKIVCDQPGGGAFNINLPAGVDGMHFDLVMAFTNTATFTLVPDGADALDGNVQAILNSAAPTPITFIGGTWYAV